jgi:hypothetical protein
MNKLIIVAFLIITISCNNNDEKITAIGYNKDMVPQKDGGMKTVAQPNANVPNGATVGSANVPANGQINTQLTPEQITQMQHQMAAQNKPLVPKGYKGPLNPEHGKPGHRCDLAVGAPLLNVGQPVAGQPVQQNQQIPANILQQMKAQQAQSQAKAQNVNVAPGMNPPHGQPGHRCDIAVGQPLDSKPAANPVTASGAMIGDIVPNYKDSVKRN